MPNLTFICRHGESEANAQGIVAGTIDSPLTLKGIRQAEILRDQLRNIPFKAIFSSGLIRAYDTAKIIAEPHGLEVEQWHELHEINFGEAQGKTKHLKDEPSALERLGEGTLKGAETLEELEMRAWEIFHKIALIEPRPICVVGHASFTAILYAVYEGLPRDQFVEYRKKIFNFENGEVVTMEI